MYPIFGCAYIKKSLPLKQWQTLNKHEDIKREYKKNLGF